MKKNPGDIIILQRCTKNHDYRLYFPKIWHLTNVIAIFYLGLFFALLSPVTAQKIKISKKWKKAPGYIIILHKCSKTHDHILYCSWDMVCDEYNCFFSFWATFCPFTHPPPPPNPKIKISKKWKNAWRYHNFTPAYQKSWLDDVWFLKYGVRWTGRQMDRRTEEVTYRGVCPKYPGNIILHLCPMSGNHMVHDSWDMEHERHNFLSFWTIFFSFYTPNKSENQNHEQIKTPGDIIILHMCTINENHVSWKF